jgi:uncharacterized membrane protein
LAYTAASALFLAGAAIQWRGTARAGLLGLSMLYTLCAALLHLPRIAAHPSDLSTWAGAAEQLALVAAGLMALATHGSHSKALSQVARILFASCLFSFGLMHFAYASATASFVPKWIPAGQMFWVYATGLAQWAAGAAILSRHFEPRAAQLLTAMYIVFGILVHAPTIAADPGSHFAWTANAMNLALIGAAWVFAGSVNRRT